MPYLFLLNLSYLKVLSITLSVFKIWYFKKMHVYKCYYKLILTVVTLFFAKMLTLHIFAWWDYGCNNFLYFQSYL